MPDEEPSGESGSELPGFSKAAALEGVIERIVYENPDNGFLPSTHSRIINERVSNNEI